MASVSAGKAGLKLGGYRSGETAAAPKIVSANGVTGCATQNRLAPTG